MSMKLPFRVYGTLYAGKKLNYLPMTMVTCIGFTPVLWTVS